jgi:hypothetical protein
VVYHCAPAAAHRSGGLKDWKGNENFKEDIWCFLKWSLMKWLGTILRVALIEHLGTNSIIF